MVRWQWFVPWRKAGGMVAKQRSLATVLLGAQSAEMFGDYRFGPKRAPPTGGVTRSATALELRNCYEWLAV